MLVDRVPDGAYARFLFYANQAARVATPEQRQLIRALASQHLSPQENSEGICRIMGWSE